ncbi:putative pbsp domain-containing protein [Venturia nashicola]|nr:putative pbsp domain-containing protein [Venturia nashicola]
MPPTIPGYLQQPTTPATSKPKPKHPPVPSLPRKPLLRLEIRDLSSKASLAFLSLPSSGSILQNAVEAVLAWLYTPSSTIPPTRSITLILRDMDGVAYTTGSDIDGDHKEIHFSTSYIEGQMHKDGFEKEVIGVITHEMVHCWQWDARGTCPGGLIEGIADFVRLRAGFVPGHWKKEGGGDWDAGYQHTGYFLDYLEKRFGDGTVVKINETLRNRVYKEKTFWKECCGCEVKDLWEEYGRHLQKRKEKGNDGQVSEESFEIVDSVDDDVDSVDDDNDDDKDGEENMEMNSETRKNLQMLEQQSLSMSHETESSHPSHFDPSSEGNAPPMTDIQLQDHQMQMTLLQQQYRKRLRVARQEHDETPGTKEEDQFHEHQDQSLLREQRDRDRLMEDHQESLRLLERGNGRRENKVRTEEDEVVDATNPFL